MNIFHTKSETYLSLYVYLNGHFTQITKIVSHADSYRFYLSYLPLRFLHSPKLNYIHILSLYKDGKFSEVHISTKHTAQKSEPVCITQGKKENMFL